MNADFSQIWNIEVPTIPAMGHPADYIERRMEQDGDNVHSLAKKAKMNHSTLHRILKRENEVRWSTLQPLAKFYGVDVDEFYREPQQNPLEGLPLRDVKRWVLSQGYDSEQYKDLADAIFQAALGALPSDDDPKES